MNIRLFLLAMVLSAGSVAALVILKKRRRQNDGGCMKRAAPFFSKKGNIISMADILQVNILDFIRPHPDLAEDLMQLLL